MQTPQFRVAAFLTFLNWCIAFGRSQDQPASIQLPKLQLVTESRIGELADQRSEWNAYLAKSKQKSIEERLAIKKELDSLKLTSGTSAPSGKFDFDLNSHKADEEWFKGDFVSQIAQSVISFQTPSGAWSKAVDYNVGPRKTGMHWTSQSGSGWHYCGTIDNRATTEEMRFLALHFSATGSEESKKSFFRGFQWLMDAQYPSGGWPQVYPLERGYHEAITLNDSAMTHVLELLSEIAVGKPPFAFVDSTKQELAEAAVARGVDCLIRCQIVIDGVRTVWCAQHDPIDLLPVGARLKEPPSLSGAESADLVKFLMRNVESTPSVKLAIESAVDWFEKHSLKGLRKTKNAQGKTEYNPDPSSTEVLWARFYDIKTQQPIFAGAQDGIIYNSFNEMARHNKVAYDYFTTRPQDVITKEFVRWRKKQ